MINFFKRRNPKEDVKEKISQLKKQLEHPDSDNKLTSLKVLMGYMLDTSKDYSYTTRGLLKTRMMLTTNDNAQLLGCMRDAKVAIHHNQEIIYRGVLEGSYHLTDAYTYFRNGDRETVINFLYQSKNFLEFLCRFYDTNSNTSRYVSVRVAWLVEDLRILVLTLAGLWRFHDYQ